MTGELLIDVSAAPTGIRTYFEGMTTVGVEVRCATCHAIAAEVYQDDSGPSMRLIICAYRSAPSLTDSTELTLRRGGIGYGREGDSIRFGFPGAPTEQVGRVRPSQRTAVPEYLPGAPLPALRCQKHQALEVDPAQVIRRALEPATATPRTIDAVPVRTRRAPRA